MEKLLHECVDCIAITILLKKPSTTSVKITPYLSKADRIRHGILMKERWKLISSGSSRSDIKVRDSSIYLNHVLFGKLDNQNSFQIIAPSSGL